MSLPVKEWMNKVYIWTPGFMSLNDQMTHNSDKYFWKPYKTKYAFIIQGIYPTTETRFLCLFRTENHLCDQLKIRHIRPDVILETKATVAVKLNDNSKA